MSRALAWARRHGSAVILVMIVTCVSGSSLLWNAHSQAAFRAGLRHEQVVAQRAGQAAEAKLCKTLAELAALQPPSGSPRANPARGYEQAEHATLSQLGPDIGCKG